MPAPTTEKVGKGPCPHCGEGLFFRRSKGGALTFNCQNCDASGYAQKGGDTYKKWLSMLPKAAEPASSEPAPAATPKASEPAAPKAPPAPARRVPSSVFSLGDL